MNLFCLIEQYLLEHPLYGVFKIEMSHEDETGGLLINPINISTDRHQFICNIAQVGESLYGRIGFWGFSDRNHYDLVEDRSMPENFHVELIHSRYLGKIMEPKMFENLDILLRDFINEVDEWISLKIRCTATFGDRR